jgi:hypothetical protein
MSQSKDTTSSVLISSTRWHPIREGRFPCSGGTTPGWPDKFKIKHTDKYDGFSNPKKIIQVYQTVIEAAGGDDQVKTNYLPTALSGTTRSWLINLPKGFIYT